MSSNQAGVQAVSCGTVRTREQPGDGGGDQPGDGDGDQPSGPFGDLSRTQLALLGLGTAGAVGVGVAVLDDRR